MNEVSFVASREPDWKRIMLLSDKADASAARLDGEELVEFVELYRKSAGDLATVRTRSSNVELAEFLNSVVGRAYGILYRKPKRTFREGLRGVLSIGAQTVRRRKGFILASFAILLCGLAFAATVMQLRPDLRRHFVPAEAEPLFSQWKSGKFEERSFTESFAMQVFYSSNNPRVAILAGSVAASTFGVGTFFLLWENGVILGALGQDMASVGRLDHLLVSIAPHGATELTGAIVSGAAGLCLGWALIAPGRRSRGEALKLVGKDAFVLLVMAIVMMFLAAPIEGFFSFNPRVPSWLKAAFGALSMAAWFLYWWGFAREPAEESTIPTESV